MKNDYVKQSVKYLGIIIGICAFGIFIYPGLYKYDKLDQKYPVMINRITGETRVLRGDIWSTVGNVDAQMSKFIEYKEGIEATLDIQSNHIKESVLGEIKGELEAAKNQVIDETNTALKDGHEYDDLRGSSSTETSSEIDFDAVRNRNYTGEYFGKGDTQETVKSIMGVPDSISGVGPYETWFYELSRVSFDDGKVSGWNNTSDNLHLK